MKNIVVVMISCMMLSSCDLIQSMVNPPDYSFAGSTAEKEELMSIYVQTGGCDWINQTKWGTSYPLSQWYGITTNSDGHVTSINLQSNNLTGVISIGLSAFPYLESVNIDDNPLAVVAIDGCNKLREVTLRNCCKDNLNLRNIERVEIVDCNQLSYYTYAVDTLIIRDCQIEDSYIDYDVDSPAVTRIENCSVNSFNSLSPYLYIIKSDVNCHMGSRTSEYLEIVDSSCDEIGPHNFEDGTVIVLKNATIMGKTLTANIYGSQWDSLW